MSECKTTDLASRITKRLLEEYQIGNWGIRFCDEPAGFESAEESDIAQIIGEVINAA